MLKQLHVPQTGNYSFSVQENIMRVSAIHLKSPPPFIGKTTLWALLCYFLNLTKKCSQWYMHVITRTMAFGFDDVHVRKGINQWRNISMDLLTMSWYCRCTIYGLLCGLCASWCLSSSWHSWRYSEDTFPLSRGLCSEVSRQ